MSRAVSSEGASVSASYSTSVRTCPICEGRVYLSAHAQYIDPPCPCCGDTGTVDIEQFCTCGRPIVFKYKGYVICASKACRDAVDKVLEKDTEKKKITNAVKKLEEDDEDDDNLMSSSWWQRNYMF